ncbi:hypothetical protein [Roseomonas populi]|uniref:Uncharacterized protein n=1 Tax=Roseomonas populi TaxID=3121582 RepID=A0ABT1X3L3_9PROT|nr:hypothetical protein [Roseomonas pecuniae]MCR0982691.1 hypothetical protein [Roseomonas pecuniae]
MDGMTWPGTEGKAEMDPDTRRIVAVVAHRSRAGRCPVLVHALGTGESFVIEPLPDGFRDVASGQVVRPGPDSFVLDGAGPVDLQATGDLDFEGFDHASGERFTGRAGGGASVTIYGGGQADYFQYAMSYRPDGSVSQPG